MMRFVFTTVVALFICSSSSSAFQATTKMNRMDSISTTTLFKSHNDNEDSTTPITSSSRRKFMAGITGSVFGAVMSVNTQPAQATYSAYTRREEDWKARETAGEINYKTAKDLRSSLREIVPQNAENSKIFCPNGPSANVSPLMENKCGDKLAIPSVYGRTEDVLGNSIPGFAGGFYTSGINKPSADTGGMPDYGFTAQRSDKFMLK